MNKMVRRGEAPRPRGNTGQRRHRRRERKKGKTGKGRDPEQERKRHSSQGRGGRRSVIRQKIVEQ